MKKIYQTPESIENDIRLESSILAISMEIGGEVDGPAGTQHKDNPKWYDKNFKYWE